MTRISPVLLGWLLACGCTSEKPVPDASTPPSCPNVAVREGAFPVTPGVAGQPTQVQFGIALQDCHQQRASILPTERVEVLGPDNQPLAFTLDAGLGDTAIDYMRFLPETPAGMAFPAGMMNMAYGEFVQATVAFTPVKSGVHHITVAFDPDLGTTQVDVEVGEDRRPASFQTVPTSLACEAFALVGGVALCSSQGVLYAELDGGQTGSINAFTFIVSGDRVWSLYQDNGGGCAIQLDAVSDAGVFSRLASLDVTHEPIATDVVFNRSSIAVSGDRAIVVAAPTLQEFSFDGGLLAGAFTLLPTFSLAGLIWFPDAGVLFGSNENLMASAVESVCLVPGPDGGALCAPGRSLGSDGRVMWSLDGFAVTGWSFDADGGLLQSTSFLGELDLRISTIGYMFGGPYRRDPAPLGVELLALDPTPALLVYGAPAGDDTPIGLGSSANLYWEQHGGVITYLVR